ncbi:MBL fold metallo-hydrolase [bacterium]|nr:MBL fold metallo-hydrolase [bacterium]
MKIKIWGARGSIPSPGKETLKYGGNTTCLEIRPKSGSLIVVDAGSGIRSLGNHLLKEKGLSELFLVFTHSHWDHLLGFPFFKPAYFSRFKINVYGGPNALESLRSFLLHQMSAPYFPVEFNVMKAKFSFGYECPNIGTIGLVDFIPIPLSHPNGGYGFKFVAEDKTFVFLTDNEPDFPHPGGLKREDYIGFCRGADLLLHDAQYTDEEYKVTRGWGHSTYFSATQMAISAKVKSFGIFHHDPDRTDEDLDSQLKYCKKLIHDAGENMNCFAASEGMDIRI